MGKHRFTYVLMPHYGPYNQAGVVRAAYALNAPVRSAPLPIQQGQSGALPPFLSCDDRNLVIEAVKKAEDSGELIVRLYECHNSRGRAELTCARSVLAAYLCDLEENVIAELDVLDGIVGLDYKPFEIVTIKLSL
jgi:alpha-mannosidase